MTNKSIEIFDIFYADLSKNIVGSEQSGTRPVIVIQNDIGNMYSPTVIVLSVTSKIKKENMPTHCIIHSNSGNGLDVDSTVLAEQICSIDKTRLKGKIGHIYNKDDQNAIVRAYMANIIGKNKYNAFWNSIIDKICTLIKEVTDGQTTYRNKRRGTSYDR